MVEWKKKLLFGGMMVVGSAASACKLQTNKR